MFWEYKNLIPALENKKYLQVTIRLSLDFVNLQIHCFQINCIKQYLLTSCGISMQVVHI